MKKTFAVILAFLLIFIYTVPTHAAEYNDGYDSEIHDVTEFSEVNDHGSKEYCEYGKCTEVQYCRCQCEDPAPP